MNDPKTSDIRAGIEQTRAQMTGTIQAIEERLSPAHLKEQASDVGDHVKAQVSEVAEHIKREVVGQLGEVKEKIRNDVKEQIREAKASVRDATIGRVEHMVHEAEDTMADARDSLVETIKQNPIPAALAGVGILWLLMNRRRPSRDGWAPPPRGRMRAYGERMQHAASDVADHVRDAAGNLVDRAGNVVHRAGDMAHDAEHRVADMAHRAGDGVSHLAHRAGEGVSDFAHRAHDRGAYLARRAQEGAYRIEHKMEDTIHENPLAVAAGALAVGLAVGLALPQTRRENELMGAARNQLLDKVQHVAHDAIDKAGDMAEKMGASDGMRSNGTNGTNGVERRSIG